MCYMFEFNLLNMMKDECNAKQKHSFEFVLPSRLLYIGKYSDLFLHYVAFVIKSTHILCIYIE